MDTHFHIGQHFSVAFADRTATGQLQYPVLRDVIRRATCEFETSNIRNSDGWITCDNTLHSP